MTSATYRGIVYKLKPKIILTLSSIFSDNTQMAIFDF